MKKLLFTALLLVSVQFLSAQAWLKELKVDEATKSANFYELQEAFNKYWADFNLVGGKYLKNNELQKAPSWKQFKRWEWYWETRINKMTGEFPKTTSAIELKKYKNTQSQLKTRNANWSSVGPSSSPGGYNGIGRVNCVTFHPTNANIFWIGSPSGGLWSTTDGGLNWTVLTDGNEVLGVSDIAIPSDYDVSQTIYIATGDRDGGSSWTLGGGNYSDNNSIGLLKSTDGGLTWINAGLNKDVSAGAKTGFLRIHPTNNSILYAGQGGRIYKSTDNAATWIEIFNNSDYVIDFEFNTENPDIVYACTKNSWEGNTKIIKSINGGSNWTIVHQFNSQDGRVELAVADNNSSIVYAAVAKTWGGLSGIYKSKDSGDSFAQVFDGSLANNALLGWYGDGSGDNVGQGNYDLAIAVSPTNSNEIYLGGVNTWRSRDGGVSWGIVSVWTSYSGYNTNNSAEVHADKHCLKFNGATLYEGNDGGIYKSPDGSNWTDLSNGITISQMYRLGVSASTDNLVITGLQDNGSKTTESGGWNDVKGGDGMECLIDYSNSSTQYASYVNGQISRTVNNWGSSAAINENIGDGTLEGSWVTPYIINPKDPNTIYVGYESIWKSNDRGNTFTKYSSISTGENFRSMAMAPSDTAFMYIADHSNIWKTSNNGLTWNVITGLLPVSNNSITYIAIDANDPNTVWVTIGGYNNQHVFESIDGGNNWKDISSGLPNLPVFSIIQNKQVTSSNHLYLATDIGVYMKDGENDWISYSSEIPNVMVTELDIYYDEITPSNSKLYAATYGRGLWVSSLIEGPDIALDAQLYRVINPEQKNYCGSSLTNPSIIIKNSGNDTIKSFTISYTINSEQAISQEWTGLLSSGHFETVSFPEIKQALGEHSFTTSVSNINGGNDEVATNNSKSFFYSVVEDHTSFPLLVGFNSSYIPGCWSYELVNNAGPIGSPKLSFVETGSESIIIPAEGTHMVEFNAQFCDVSDTIRLISPLLPEIASDIININFSWHEDNGNGRKLDRIMVQWSFDGLVWNDIKSFNRYNSNNLGWVDKSITLSSASLQGKSIFVGLLFISGNGTNCYLDNLRISVDQDLINIGTLNVGPHYVSDTKSASIDIPYTTNSVFTTNTFTAYLSDATGHFTNETSIGSLESNMSGTISGLLPANTPSGNGYKIRIKSSNPVYTSSESVPFEVIFDDTKPNVVISSTVGSSTNINPIIVKFTFSEVITGFELTDIIVTNGSASNLISLNTLEYQADITATNSGLVYVDIPANAVLDSAENPNNVATRWSTEYVSNVGIEELSNDMVSIFPNPSNGIFTLEFSKYYEHVKINIIDLKGAIHYSKELDHINKHDINIEAKPSGIYILNIIVDNKMYSTQLIVNRL